MAKFDVYNLEKQKVGEIELADAVFAGEVNEHLFYEVVKAKLASDRAGTHAVKNRSLVSGGGKKPWKQKGTGRARQGSTRASPVGGRRQGDGAEAARLRLRRAAQGAEGGAPRGALAAQPGREARDRQTLEPAAPKTTAAGKVLAKLGAEKALVVDVADNQTLARSVRNLRRVRLPARRGAQRLRHPEARRAGAHRRRRQEAGGAPVMNLVPGRHEASAHHREARAEARGRAPVRLRGRPEGQQDPGQARGRAAVQGARARRSAPPSPAAR